MNSTKATGVQSLDDELSSTTSTSAIDIVNVRRPSRGTSRQDTMDVSAQSDLSSYQSPSAFKILGDPLIWLSSPLKHEQVVTSKVRATSHTAGDPWLNGDTYAWGTRFIHEGECGGVKLWHGEGTDLRLLHNLLAEQDVTQTVWCAHVSVFTSTTDDLSGFASLAVQSCLSGGSGRGHPGKVDR